MNTELTRETLHTVLAKLQQANNLILTAPPSSNIPEQVGFLLKESIADIRKALGIRRWPAPTMERPIWKRLKPGCGTTVRSY